MYEIHEKGRLGLIEGVLPRLPPCFSASLLLSQRVESTVFSRVGVSSCPVRPEPTAAMQARVVSQAEFRSRELLLDLDDATPEPYSAKCSQPGQEDAWAEAPNSYVHLCR